MRLGGVRKKDSYLKSQFLRIKARRGPKKAIMAVAASILIAIYHMLKDGTLYQDLGSNHFQNRSKGQQTKRLVKRLADLGYDVALTPLPTNRVPAEQVSFLLVPHRALPDLQRMKLCYSAAASSAPRSVFAWCD